MSRLRASEYVHRHIAAAEQSLERANESPSNDTRVAVRLEALAETGIAIAVALASIADSLEEDR